MKNVLFDMETSDPDDVFTLCFLLSHPQISLKAITVTPGSIDQVSLVKHILKILNTDLPIGSRNINHPKSCVSDFHYNWLGKNIDKKSADDEGYKIINETIKKYPDLVVLTGGPLGNIGNLINNFNPILNEIVVQGGLAGDNVVPEEYRLEKFKGRITCPTFNLNGDAKSALLTVYNNNFKNKFFVSKNVCHGMLYDNEMHEIVKSASNKNQALQLLIDGMDKYLKYHSRGKLFHDPLAASVIVNKKVCDFSEVELFRSKGEWGCNLKQKTNTYISVRAHKDMFIDILIGGLG